MAGRRGDVQTSARAAALHDNKSALASLMVQNESLDFFVNVVLEEPGAVRIARESVQRLTIRSLKTTRQP